MDDGLFTLSSNGAVTACAGELESLTWNVRLKTPESAAVPEMTPAADKLSPVGSEPPEIDQLYGVFPPVAPSVALYEVFICAVGSTGVVICSDATERVMVMLRFAVALCAGELESVTFTVDENVPALVGIPPIWPELLRLKPVGREPELTDQL